MSASWDSGRLLSSQNLSGIESTKRAFYGTILSGYPNVRKIVTYAMPIDYPQKITCRLEAVITTDMLDIALKSRVCHDISNAREAEYLDART